jgi:hypothetical protein
VWNVEATDLTWQAVGRVLRVRYEHYIASYRGKVVGSTETRRAAIDMVKEAHREADSAAD